MGTQLVTQSEEDNNNVSEPIHWWVVGQGMNWGWLLDLYTSLTLQPHEQGCASGDSNATLLLRRRMIPAPNAPRKFGLTQEKGIRGLNGVSLKFNGSGPVSLMQQQRTFDDPKENYSPMNKEM